MVYTLFVPIVVSPKLITQSLQYGSLPWGSDDFRDMVEI